MTRRHAVAVIVAAAAIAACGSSGTPSADSRSGADRKAADLATLQAGNRVRPWSEPIERARTLSAAGDVLTVDGTPEASTFVFRPRVPGERNRARCFRIVFDAWRGRVDGAVPCPTSPTVSLPPTTVAGPSLASVLWPIRNALAKMTVAARRDSKQVDAVLEPLASSHNATLTLVANDGVIGAAVFRARDFDCILVRLGATVEVWRPASVYRLYGRPGEMDCTPKGAIARVQQHPPH